MPEPELLLRLTLMGGRSACRYRTPRPDLHRTTVGDAEWPPERRRLGESSLGTDEDEVQTERRETGM